MARFVAKRFQRRVQELVDDSLDRAMNQLAIFLFEVRQLGEELPLLFLANLPPSFAKLRDNRAGRLMIDVLDEAAGFLVDDAPSPINFFRPLTAILFASCFQGLDVVEKDVFVDVADRRVSKSRGVARSRMKTGFSPATFRTAAKRAASTIGRAAPVVLTMTSAFAIQDPTRRTAAPCRPNPPPAARPARRLRLTTMISRTPSSLR